MYHAISCCHVGGEEFAAAGELLVRSEATAKPSSLVPRTPCRAAQTSASLLTDRWMDNLQVRQ